MRKLKKVIEIADFWLQYPLDCEFSENRPAYMETFRDAEAYTVMLSEPSETGRVLMKIVPKGRPLASFSDLDRENIVYNELNLFRVTMIFQEMEEKKIRLDKAGRRQLQEYLSSRETGQQAGS